AVPKLRGRNFNTDGGTILVGNERRAEGREGERGSPAEVRQAAPGDAKPGPRRISLALQGGGAHGAFSWGVLDRLLEDDRIFIEGVSGTSAGAMNAAALAAGYAQGGREGARQ